jgi:hypothetical protein
MRRKVGTVLDEALFRRARLESARQGRAISEILADALEAYLKSEGRHGANGVVADTWAVFRLEKARVKEFLGGPSPSGARAT